MSSVSNGIKLFGALMLGLFLLTMITGLTFLGIDKLKETTCESQVDGYYWSGDTCYNSSTAPQAEVTIDAITHIGTVGAGVVILVSLVGLFVVVAVFAVLYRVVKGAFQTGF